VTFQKNLAIAIVTITAAAGLAGCATSPVPVTVEEQLWFDKATGYDINHVSPELRFEGLVGYPRTDFRGYAPPPDYGGR
jgi:hypothetical protein